MPRTATYPTLYEDLRQLSIGFLNRHGYLEPGISKSHVISWTRGGRKTASIRVTSVMSDNAPFVFLQYVIGEQKHNEKIDLECLPSNLGKGVVWFFLCPRSGKRCRKLYLSKGQFVHREECHAQYYEKQVESKYSRMLDQTYGAVLRADMVWEEIYSKHFKRYYAGKPTKRYLRLWAKIEKARKVRLPELPSMKHW